MTTTMRTFAIAAAGGALTLAAVGWWAWRAPSPPAPVASVANPPPAAPNAKTAAASPGSAPAAVGAVVRLDGRYRAEYWVDYQAPSPQGGVAKAQLHIAGSVDAVPLAGAPAERWLALRLQADDVTANAALRASIGMEDAAFARAASDPFAVRIGDDGSVMAIRFAAATPPTVCAMLAAWAQAAQFVQPKDRVAAATGQPGPRKWQAHERDAQGDYQAGYLRRDDGDYDKIWLDRAAQGPFGRKQATQVRFQLAGATLAYVYWQQSGSLDLAQLGTATGQAWFGIRLTLERSGAADVARVASVDPAALVDFDPATASAAAPAAQPTLPVAELVRAMQAEGATPAPLRRSDWRSAAIDALQARPNAAAEVDAALRAGNLSEPAERTLLEALAGAGTPAAQEVLAGLAMDAAIAGSLRDRALVASTQAVDPSPAFVAALLRGVDAGGGPVAATTYAVPLGAAVRKLNESDPVRARALSGELTQRAKNALVGRNAGAGAPSEPTLADQRNWLAALGNAGDAAALPVVLNALQSPKAAVRLAAAHALRFQSPNDCKEQMALAMANDDAAEVRAALVHAARFMGPAAMQTFVDKALRFDRAELVRTEAAYTIASWSVAAPGLRKMLATALAAEKSAKVQASIQGLLTPPAAADSTAAVPK